MPTEGINSKEKQQYIYRRALLSKMLINKGFPAHRKIREYDEYEKYPLEQNGENKGQKARIFIIYTIHQISLR
jgi:hypothetical protein